MSISSRVLCLPCTQFTAPRACGRPLLDHAVPHGGCRPTEGITQPQPREPRNWLRPTGIGADRTGQVRLESVTAAANHIHILSASNSPGYLGLTVRPARARTGGTSTAARGPSREA